MAEEGRRVLGENEVSRRSGPKTMSAQGSLAGKRGSLGSGFRS